jgi:Fe-S-cluster formation regulator IscX/YfhJ
LIQINQVRQVELRNVVRDFEKFEQDHQVFES